MSPADGRHDPVWLLGFLLSQSYFPRSNLTESASDFSVEGEAF